MESNSEIEDFERVLRENGYDIADFRSEYKEEPGPPGHAVIYPIRATMRIANVRTGASRVYQAGHATAWVAEFQKDLVSGAFDR